MILNIYSKFGRLHNIKHLFLCLIGFAAIVFTLSALKVHHSNQKKALYDLQLSNLREEKIFIDLQLTIRKLSLFAVYELNKVVAASENNPCAKFKNCSKWWTNPVTAKLVNTTDFENPNYREHKILFVGDPGKIPVMAMIRQYPINMTMPSAENLAKFTELEIIGSFKRLGKQNVFGDPILFDAPPEPFPLGTSLSSYYAEENENDTELYSWKRNQSFMAADYVDFEDQFENLYNISPKKPQSSFCGSSLKMLVMICSAPIHFENRKVIRETFASEQNLRGKQILVVFIFGRVKNQTLQNKLEKEADKFDDTIQGNFMDSYHNLSLNDLLLFNWIQRICGQVELPRYLFKTDDDYFFNLDLALKVAYANPQYELIGTPFCGTQPLRNVTFYKYYTPKYMYASDKYVGYLSGVAYLLRTDIILRILKISMTTPLIHMDDVYVTGILPRQIGVRGAQSKLIGNARIKPETCALHQVVSSLADNASDIRVQWNEWVKPLSPNCFLTQIAEHLAIKPFREFDTSYCYYDQK